MSKKKFKFQQEYTFKWHFKPTEDPCALCGESTLGYSFYHVKDEVWKEAGLRKEDFAHASCLSVQLGRLLTAEDFSGALINDTIFAIFGMHGLMTFPQHIERNHTATLEETRHLRQV